jgi:hypothetical protein
MPFGVTIRSTGVLLIAFGAELRKATVISMRTI